MTGMPSFTSILVAALALLSTTSAEKPRVKNHETHDYYAIQLQPEADPRQVALTLGLDYDGQLGEIPDHHTFSSPKHRRHAAEDILEETRRRRRRRDLVGLGPLEHIRWHQKQRQKPRMVKRDIIPGELPRQGPPVESVTKSEPGAHPEAVAERTDLQRKLDILDPIFHEQWHLFNAVQLGHDLNVTGVWQRNITGVGATAVMVDDGIDMYSEDLKDNYFAEGSYDFNDHTDEPKPRLADDRHGTRCAGEIAAVKNGVCGVGVAYNARIGGIRILSKIIDDEDEATAMNYKFQDNQIYSCSWGPPDDGKSMDAPGLLIRKALVNGVQNGRQGKGNLFVFAAGNGNNAGDNCNFDGYTNSIYTITIGGIDREGKHPYYSEHCSAQLVVTYSSGAGDAIHTTDVGVNKCYSNHGGTSAAAPLGAGIFALALSARPELTWRDVQNLCVLTAVPINLDEEWQTTSLGKKFSHTYGYGKLDAFAFVEKAQSVDLLKPQAWFTAPWVHVDHPIPQGVEGLLSTFTVTKDQLKDSNLETVEQVTVTMNVEHARRGDLSVELRSPTNVISHLSVARRLDDEAEGYVDWTFMTVAHWGESGVGKWSIVVKDTNVNEHNGSFTDWRLTLWGECIDPEKQELLPMPTESDDEDHEVVSASPTIVSVQPGETASVELPANPTDHQLRPTNAKPDIPTATATDDTSPTGEATDIAHISEIPEIPDEPPEEEVGGEGDEHFLPHYFPTFGVSKRTQIWIYGSAAIIILFCAGLGIYFYIVRRRRNKIQRDDYEFEMLDDDDDVGGGGGRRGTAQNGGLGSGGRGGKRHKRRAGELYDAFAGESDEEQLLSDEDDDEELDEDGAAAEETDRRRKVGEKEAYRDQPLRTEEEGREDPGRGTRGFRDRRDLSEKR